ncbi:MAG: hypothetical protein LQ351_004821 [Letrouitia transgressa]|nr:MAG: hypothetical protein LQ351_004821 [Letrouitia transgressa]
MGDIFDDVLDLENEFYNEGYDLGRKDGHRAGLIEGRLFGLEKGFEKYVAMGRLHGKSAVWAERLLPPQHQKTGSNDDERTWTAETRLSLLKIPENPRLEKHIRTLFALTEPANLETDNSENSVSDFDDRLKRADGKVKIIEKLIKRVATDDVDSAPKGEQTNQA